MLANRMTSRLLLLLLLLQLPDPAAPCGQPRQASITVT
jgi:hypothetical protein